MNVIVILLSVVSIWTIAVITPGPNFFITVQKTVKQSRPAGLFVVLGTCTGTVVWTVAGYFGISYLFIAIPWIYTILKMLGGSYIIYLGTTLIINSLKAAPEKDIPPEIIQNNFSNWRTGFITNLSNPKTAMFISSLFASVLPKEPDILIGSLIVTLMVGISLVWYSFVVFIFSHQRITALYNRMQKWLEGIAGIIFLAFGVKLIFGDR